MNARQRILIDLIDVEMDQACECINAGLFEQAVLHWLEIAEKTRQLKAETEIKSPEPKQLTIDIPQ